MGAKKQTESILMLNAIIPKACKSYPRNGKSQVYKKLLQWELQELLFEVSPNKSDDKIFWWKQENPNFRPSYRNVNLPLKLNCISICRLKIYRHMQKNFEKSSAEILRKVAK